METPGHATNIWPYRQILTIDYMLSGPEAVETDISMLNERYARYAVHPRKEYDDFVEKMRKQMTVESGPRGLTQKVSPGSHTTAACGSAPGGSKQLRPRGPRKEWVPV